HAGRVEVAEERFSGLVLAVHEVQRGGKELLVDRLHALPRERSRILDLSVRRALQDASGSELLLERRVLGVVRVLGLLLGVQVIEVTEELVEAVGRRKELVLLAEMVLSELPCCVSQLLEELGNGRILFLKAEVSARQSDLRQAGSDGRLSGDER